MIAAIIARLRDVAELKRVDGLGQWSALDAPPAQVPCAYVLPATTDASPNGVAAGGFRQALTKTAQVLTVVRNLRDSGGGAASLDLVAVRDAARAALLGWVPAPRGERAFGTTGWEPLELVSGALFGMEGDALVWRDLVRSRSQFMKL